MFAYLTEISSATTRPSADGHAGGRGMDAEVEQEQRQHRDEQRVECVLQPCLEDRVVEERRAEHGQQDRPGAAGQAELADQPPRHVEQDDDRGDRRDRDADRADQDMVDPVVVVPEPERPREDVERQVPEHDAELVCVGLDVLADEAAHEVVVDRAVVRQAGLQVAGGQEQVGADARHHSRCEKAIVAREERRRPPCAARDRLRHVNRAAGRCLSRRPRSASHGGRAGSRAAPTAARGSRSGRRASRSPSSSAAARAG